MGNTLDYIYWPVLSCVFNNLMFINTLTRPPTHRWLACIQVLNAVHEWVESPNGVSSRVFDEMNAWLHDVSELPITADDVL